MCFYTEMQCVLYLSRISSQKLIVLPVFVKYFNKTAEALLLDKISDVGAGNLHVVAYDA